MNRNLLLTCLLIASCSLIGCGQNPPAKPDVAKSEPAAHDHDEHGHSHGKDEKGGHTHGAWWCDEHGVPEAECAQCDAKVAAAFKKKGDWCKEHDRPDSQCFLCHPEKLEEYAAKYEAKYGRKAPKPELN